MWEVWFIQSIIIFLPRKHLPFLVVGSSCSSGRLFVAVLLHKPKKSPLLLDPFDKLREVPSNFGDLILFFSRKSRFSRAVGGSTFKREDFYITTKNYRLSIPAYDTIAMR